jgi:hypothetical protein
MEGIFECNSIPNFDLFLCPRFNVVVEGSIPFIISFLNVKIENIFRKKCHLED